MSQMKKKIMLWSNLKLPFKKQGRYEKEDVINSLMSKPSNTVNEEYKEAFRTKSYIDICKKVKGQMETRKSLDQPSTSSSSPPRNVHFSEWLLDPGQETLEGVFQGLNPHQLFLDYFEISMEASKACELLLRNVHRVRANYRVLKSAINLIMMRSVSADYQRDDDTEIDHCHAVYRNLASFVMLRNPLSSSSTILRRFNEIHKSHIILLHRLTSKCRRVNRRTRLLKCFKKVMASFLVVICSSLAISLLVFTSHGMLGMVALPGMTFCSLGVFVKKFKTVGRKLKGRRGERLGAQLDVAAKAVYILINDFHTLSWLVRKLHDEMEHRKLVADMCVRKGKNEMLKGVLREFQMQETSLVEQLEELEKQIYLCFLNINRSRRLVLEELLK